MKRMISRLFALVLVAVVGLMGCTADPGGMTGDYRQDTLSLVGSLRNAVETPEDSPNKKELQKEARVQINAFAARYGRDSGKSTLTSFTTMRTALNSLAGHYSTYPNRPVPEKLKKRLLQELQQVEVSLERGR
ncbi:photosystem II protein Psb27 [Leptolyngbya sp. FACHB-261]|uniref:photosystem II protein Psb27 n=1 Tax=Leptolyngbya sp. FACHB-261 TaxID=2692806 RepID=UPI00168762E9|nr:photosystem II protein Psb27 [Leptolyngbya sp. FACHB-261]MBD2105066.1 photosystem II protein Psb27 [Leptolyngbya sp. FACHB-261]